MRTQCETSGTVPGQYEDQDHGGGRCRPRLTGPGAAHGRHRESEQYVAG